MAQAERQLPEQHRNIEAITLGGLSFGIYLPKEFITNEQIEEWRIATQSGKLLTAFDIQDKIGIKRRFRAGPNESPIDMAIQAAHATGATLDVDAVITSSSYPLGVNISQEISKRLQTPANFHLDIHAACSGFVRGLAYIKEHEEEFQGKKVLFVTTEKYSHTLVDLHGGGAEIDRSMAQLIFSDGAAACIFEFGKDIRVLGYENTKLPAIFNNCICMPIEKSLMREPFLEEPIPNSANGYLEQDGPSVFKRVLSYIPDLNKKVVKNADLQPSDIKLVIPHQASGRMVDGLKERMSDYTFFSDLEDGNFSSASIPKALARAIKEGAIQKGDKILLLGFGAGLYASSAIVELG